MGSAYSSEGNGVVVNADASDSSDSDQSAASAEVIVIGAGFAGLMAADRLIEEGMDVILLEK